MPEPATSDTFTDAQGRRYIAGQEVHEHVWQRFQGLHQTLDAFEEERRCGLIPRDAYVRHGHPVCRALGHTGLEYATGTEYLSSGSRRNFVVMARCSDCGRNQERLRITWPAERWLNVAGPWREG